jgi:hypothetical protein
MRWIPSTSPPSCLQQRPSERVCVAASDAQSNSALAPPILLLVEISWWQCHLVSLFMTINLYVGAHESGSWGQHRGTQGFLDRIKTPRHVCLWFMICPCSSWSYPSFYIQGGRATRKVWVGYYNDPNQDSISTCLIYNIYTPIDLR